RVKREPDGVVAVSGEQRLTCGELDGQASRLAAELQRHGVGPETIVALLLPRSLDALVGVLGVLKAGGAYLPLDVHYPAARLAFMLRDAGASVLLTHESFRTTLPESELVTVCLDSQRHLFDGPPSEVPEPGITAQNAAYVIYTSGSTGQPRGVVVPHIN